MSELEIRTEDREDRFIRVQEEAIEAAREAEAERLALHREEFEARKEADAVWRERTEREVKAFERIADALERLAP